MRRLCFQQMSFDPAIESHDRMNFSKKFKSNGLLSAGISNQFYIYSVVHLKLIIYRGKLILSENVNIVQLLIFESYQ